MAKLQAGQTVTVTVDKAERDAIEQAIAKAPNKYVGDLLKQLLAKIDA